MYTLHGTELRFDSQQRIAISVKHTPVYTDSDIDKYLQTTHFVNEKNRNKKGCVCVKNCIHIQLNTDKSKRAFWYKQIKFTFAPSIIILALSYEFALLITLVFDTYRVGRWGGHTTLFFNLMFIWPCITDTNNIDKQLDATIRVY